jgi:hypothetical protein
MAAVRSKIIKPEFSRGEIILEGVLRDLRVLRVLKKKRNSK